MAKKKGIGRDPINGFRVNQCSVCEQYVLTVGQQNHGGVRYCKDCIRHTLAWVQLSEDKRSNLMTKFNELEAMPVVKTALEAGKSMTADELKAIAIGESKRRLMESMLRENY
jgi:hypothetical protein